MNISNVGKDLIKSFEGCRLTAYKPVSTEQYYTIGWGHYGSDVYAGMTITQAQADAMFDRDIVVYVNAVNNAPLGFSPNQNQFDALCSFCYNLGTGIMSDFRGMSASQVAAEIPLYVHGGGVVLPGLVRRRNMELELFNGGGSSSGGGSTGGTGSDTITSEYSESGIAYPSMDINIRTRPSTSAEIIDQYHKGESVIYDYVVITKSYVWISYISTSGARRYMAVKDVVTGERFAECKDIPGGGGSTSGEVIQKQYAESGTAYPNQTINIRTKPNAAAGEIVGQYFVGESVVYDTVVITNKYVWISYISYSGSRRYMAVKDVVTGERFAECK